MTTVRRSAWLIVCGCLAWAAPASADPAVDWIKITNDRDHRRHCSACIGADKSRWWHPRFLMRLMASSRAFRQSMWRAKGPRHASQRAAAIQAAYGILDQAYSTPAQVAALTAQRNASIAAILIGTRCRTGAGDRGGHRVGTGGRRRHLGLARKQTGSTRIRRLAFLGAALVDPSLVCGDRQRELTQRLERPARRVRGHSSPP